MKTLFFPIIFVIVILLEGCHTNGYEKYTASLSDTTSVTGFTGDSVKLIKTASINLKVTDVRQSAKAVSRITKDLGGLIIHQNLESIENRSRELTISADSLLVISSYTPAADITARVPEQNLEEFMFNIADMGYFISSSKMDIEDKSFEYLSNHLKQQQRNKFLLKRDNKKINDSGLLQRIDINDKAIDQEITNRQINADVTYSTVQLHLFQNSLVRKEVTVNSDIDNYRLSFNKSLINALSTGWQYFLSFLLVLANLWVFILISISVWIILKNYKIKRKSVMYPERKLH